jgi:predicted phage tail protein
LDLDGNSLLASLLIGSIGFVAFAYGKKQSRLPQMLVGVALMVFPYFVTGVPLMLGIAGGLIALLVVLVKLGL